MSAVCEIVAPFWPGRFQRAMFSHRRCRAGQRGASERSSRRPGFEGAHDSHAEACGPTPPFNRPIPQISLVVFDLVTSESVRLPHAFGVTRDTAFIIRGGTVIPGRRELRSLAPGCLSLHLRCGLAKETSHRMGRPRLRFALVQDRPSSRRTIVVANWPLHAIQSADRVKRRCEWVDSRRRLRQRRKRWRRVNSFCKICLRPNVFLGLRHYEDRGGWAVRLVPIGRGGYARARKLTGIARLVSGSPEFGSLAGGEKQPGFPPCPTRLLLFDAASCFL
jgi:hypothetical protein